MLSNMIGAAVDSVNNVGHYTNVISHFLKIIFVVVFAVIPPRQENFSLLRIFFPISRHRTATAVVGATCSPTTKSLYLKILQHIHSLFFRANLFL